MKLNVPFHRQEHPHTCGPACLRMVLEFYGMVLSEGELEGWCRTTLLGTGRAELAQAAVALGFAARLVQDLAHDDVASYLAQGKPVIAVIDPSLLYAGVPGFAHSVVVVGLEEDVIVYHDPESLPNLMAPWERFKAAWDSRSRKGVIVWKP